MIVSGQSKFPNEYFMNWLRANLNNKNIRINFHYKNEPYLSDAISHNEFIYETEEDRFKRTTEIVVAELKKLKNTKKENWNPQKIVIISAQTGKGKNYFVFNKMLKELHENFPNEDNLILIVSNRIASSRQNKKQVAELLIELIATDKYRKQIQETYTSQGIDEFCIDFGIITICTYHQLLNRRLLRNKQFRYIILDECHFFTSDATFNPDTNNILQEIVTYGENSVRVYMSATPEVAFEAIVRAEYSMIQNKLYDIISPMREANEKAINEMENRIYNPLLRIITPQGEIAAIEQKLAFNIVPYPETKIQKKINDSFLEIDFYYMPRNYDYIEKIILYKTNDELLEHITASDDKWIIFVHSEKTGNDLKEKIIQSKAVTSNDCILISRPEIELESKETLEYDFIIDNEMSSKRILITTCILDNGINIKNPKNNSKKNKILNVAICSYDRTQFIQMLGRVRDNQTDKIKLYIKEFSIDDLKKNIKRDAEALISRLTNDFLSLEEKQKYFNPKMFYFTNTEEFSCYNPCAIYQLIDQMIRTLRIIRKTEKDFFVPVSGKLETLKEKVYQFYRKNYTHYWSRSIIELFDTETHHEEIENYIHIAKGQSQNWKQYYSTLDDTFTHYLFADLLPQYFLSIIEERFNSYYEKIPTTEDKNRYDILVEETLHTEHEKSTSSHYNKAIYLYKKCTLLKQQFKSTFDDLSFDFIKKIAKKIKYYETFADDNDFHSFTEEQSRWIEKSLNTFDTIPDLKTSNDTLSERIQSSAITEAELAENIHKKQNGTDSKYSEHSFLEKHGILKNSKFADELAQTYFNSQPLTNCINKTFSIGETKYILKSANSNKSGHPTYYIFIKTE